MIGSIESTIGSCNLGKFTILNVPKRRQSHPNKNLFRKLFFGGKLFQQTCEGVFENPVLINSGRTSATIIFSCNTILHTIVILQLYERTHFFSLTPFSKLRPSSVYRRRFAEVTRALFSTLFCKFCFLQPSR
jgi:hypothetical protein